MSNKLSVTVDGVYRNGAKAYFTVDRKHKKVEKAYFTVDRKHRLVYKHGFRIIYCYESEVGEFIEYSQETMRQYLPNVITSAAAGESVYLEFDQFDQVNGEFVDSVYYRFPHKTATGIYLNYFGVSDEGHDHDIHNPSIHDTPDGMPNFTMPAEDVYVLVEIN